MPSAPQRYCSVSSSCPHIQPCPVHGVREQWRTRARPEPERIRGRKLQRLRADLYAAEPQCRACKRVLTPQGMIRDHIIPLAEGGTEEPSNIQPLCQRCSDAKTHEEARRGTARRG